MYLPAFKTTLRWYWGKGSRPDSFKSKYGWVPGRLWGLSVSGNHNFFVGVTEWRLASTTERFTEGGQ